MYKYFSYHLANSKWFSSQPLLNKQQLKVIYLDLMKNPKGQDMYTTIQNYDIKGNVISCPVYADLDGGNSIKDTRRLVKIYEDTFEEEPTIYFSGGKGFHVISNFLIKHPLCYLISKHIINSFGKFKTLDQRVYNARRLFRCPCTFNTKGRRFKIPITIEELNILDYIDIYEQAKNFPKRWKFKNNKPIKDYKIIQDAISFVEEENRNRTKMKMAVMSDVAWHDGITPCLTHILENEPKEGSMNQSIFILARFFKSSNLTEEETINIIISKDHYYSRENEQKDVIKVIKCVYRSMQTGKIGCKYGEEGRFLKQFCDNSCCYSDFWDNVILGGKK